MKKRIIISLLALLIVSSINKTKAQATFTNIPPYLTPHQLFDKVHDRFGRSYSLASINLYNSKPLGGNASINSIPTASCSAGYFNLYFMPLSLFTTGSQSLQAQAVICEVFRNISGFINSPLAAPGNTVKVNILCDVVPSGSNFIGQATSFYLFPNVNYNSYPGIADGLVYKTITSGVDPFSSIGLSVFYNTATVIPAPTSFYHGYIRANPAANWNFALTTNTLASNQYDFYTVMLHEAIHALGFTSLIGQVGNSGLSIFGPTYNYYSRYDQFLKDNNGVPLISSSTASTCPNTNISYTGPLTAISSSNCVNSGTLINVTTCSVATKYASPSVTVAVYTPICYEDGSSLSHFEDMCSFPSTFTSVCTPTPATPGYNDLYYVMSNFGNTGNCFVKRYLKEEEKKVLCDIGYSTNITYTSSALGATHTYTGSCNPTATIVGVNDGFNNGAYSFTTTSASISIPLSSILTNDIPSSGLSLSCIEVVYGTGVTYTTSGGNLIVNAPVVGIGLVLLKYNPVNGSGQAGNATYIYMYFVPGVCNPANVCNMIQNWGFEWGSFSSVQCGVCYAFGASTGTALSCWNEYTPSYSNLYTYSCGVNPNFDLGVNTSNITPPAANIKGTAANKALSLYGTSTYASSLKNYLSSALIPGQAYRLSFWALNAVKTGTTADRRNLNNIPLVITAASYTSYVATPTLNFPSGLNSLISFTVPAGNAWTLLTNTFVFNPAAPTSSILMFGLNSSNMAAVSSTAVPIDIVECYIDEISLVPLPAPTFSIPQNTICAGITFTNLAQFTSTVTSGNFSGTGVTFSVGLYKFNASGTLSPGAYPIAFNYTVGGCSNTIYQLITVTTNSIYSFLNTGNLCLPTNTINLNSLFTNTTMIAGTSYSLNGFATTPQQTYFTPGAYLYTAVNSTTNMCNATFTMQVNVYSVPSAPYFLINNNPVTTVSLCSLNSFSTTTITAASNASFVTWQPSNLSGASQTLNPSVNTIYTVTAFNYSACPNGVSTVAVNVYTNCCGSKFLTPFTATSVSTNTLLAGPMVITSNFTLQPGAILTLYGDIHLRSGVKITATNASWLSLQNAHLHACENDMWSGIVLKDGAKFSTSTNDNLIEDAITAIDVSNHTTSTQNPILNISYATFNKNFIDISISNYQRSSNTFSNVFSINNCVFSCRNYTFNSTQWPQANTTASLSGLRVANNPTTGLAPPYLLQNAAIGLLKNPYATQTSSIAIKMTDVGLTSGSNFYNINIGVPTSPNNFNLFDSHYSFMHITNSNISAVNNVFQNTQYSSTNLNSGNGTAIYDEVLNNTIYALDLRAANKNIGNRFWNCHVGTQGTKVYRFNIENAIFRSTQTTTNSAYGVGNTGLLFTTNRVQYLINYNEFTNINSGINVGLIAGTFTAGASSAVQTGIYAANLSVVQNTFAPQTSTSTTLGTNYVNQAIQITGPNTFSWVVAPITTTPSNIGLVIERNTVDRVFRGILLNGVDGYFPNSIINNTISLQTDAMFNVTQQGIAVLNTSGKNVVAGNYLSGVGVSAPNNTLATLVHCSNNSGLNSPSVTCNTLSNSNQGFEFDSGNPMASWAGNIMQPLKRGLVLSGGGIIGQQGTNATAINNQWTGSWTVTNYGTFIDASSDALQSPMWVNPTSIPPNNNGFALSQQWYGGVPGTLLTTISGGYNCVGIPNNKVFNPPIRSNFYSEEMFYIARTSLYRLIFINPSLLSGNPTLTTFYNGLVSSNIRKFMQVEQKLNSADFTGARTINTAITTTNTVETNYKNYYNLYLTFGEANFKPTTVLNQEALLNLASLCPASNGACIYQARALYNVVFKKVVNYGDGCNATTGARMAHNLQTEALIQNWDLNIFPNPATNQITLESSTENEILHLSINDISGRLVLKQDVKLNGFMANLDLSLLNGAYMVTVTNSQNETIIKKLLVSK